MQVVDNASISRSYSREDIAGYAALSGQRETAINQVPEPLIGGLFSYLLGVDLPGSGTNYLKQEMEFLQPAPLGDRLTARVEITRIRADKHLVDLKTTCVDSQDREIFQGRALVLVKDVGHIVENKK